MASSEIIPALVAAGGGTALIATILAYEYRRDAAMRASRAGLGLRFPMNAREDAALSALRSLAGLADSAELVAETHATADGITHALLVPETASDAVRSGLAALPGLRIRKYRASTESARLSVRLFVPTPTFLLERDAERSGRRLLTAMAGLKDGEEVAVRWAIRPARPKSWEPDTGKDESLKPLVRAWAQKGVGSGFAAEGLILIRAESSARARELAESLASAYRALKVHGRGLRETTSQGPRRMSALPKVRTASGWLSVSEVAGLLGWPLGSELVPGVEVGGARELPVPRGVPTEGRTLFVGRDGRGPRAVALSATAARHHALILGPSGTGKSTLLVRGVLADIGAGYGGVVIDPKADLVADILDRVPAEHAERVVVLDPAHGGPAIGVNMLAGGDPDLRSDVLVSVIRGLFPDWGIRNEIYLRMGLRTLAEVPGATIIDLGRLFSDEPYRRAAVTRLRDPLMRGAWQSFEALSEAEKAQHVQAPLARIMALAGRPSVRAVIAQSEPRLDIARLLDGRGWLLVSLAPGALGEPAAALLGSVLMYSVWNAIEARATLPQAKRHPLFLYVDELASVAHLPFGFELLAERARGLGAGVTVAAQTLSRLPAPTRDALLGNVGTIVSFRAAKREAGHIAGELAGMSPEDMQSLGRYEVAARVSTGAGSAITTMTGTTLPMPEVTGQAKRIRELSADRYGVEPGDNDQHKGEPEALPDGANVGRSRRRS